jgi:hypothetical protein
MRELAIAGQGREGCEVREASTSPEYKPLPSGRFLHRRRMPHHHFFVKFSFTRKQAPPKRGRRVSNRRSLTTHGNRSPGSPCSSLSLHRICRSSRAVPVRIHDLPPPRPKKIFGHVLTPNCAMSPYHILAFVWPRHPFGHGGKLRLA